MLKDLRALNTGDAINLAEFYSKSCQTNYTPQIVPLSRDECIEKISNYNVYGCFCGDNIIAIVSIGGGGEESDGESYILDLNKREHNYLDQVLVNPKFRGRGIAGRMIRSLSIREPMWAKVHPENIGSLRMFLKNGFVIVGQCIVNGEPRLIIKSTHKPSSQNLRL